MAEGNIFLLLLIDCIETTKFGNHSRGSRRLMSVAASRRSLSVLFTPGLYKCAGSLICLLHSAIPPLHTR